MRMRKAFRMMASVLVVGGGVYITLATYACCKAYRAEKDAEILLSEVSELRPGEATAADVESLARRHSSFLMRGSPSQRLTARYFDFWYDNWLLWKLRLTPRVVFSIRLQVVGCGLDVIMVGIDSGLFPGPRYSASVSDFPQGALPGDP